VSHTAAIRGRATVLTMRLVFTLVFLIGCSSSGPAGRPRPDPGQRPSPGATLSPEQCTRRGGEVRGDIGDGRIACAQGERELGRVPLGIEGSICCAPVTPVAMLSPEQCTQQGGEIRGDIGDGRIACARGERELGRVPLGIEGSICCAPADY
jgi:hypothetical protein